MQEPIAFGEWVERPYACPALYTNGLELVEALPSRVDHAAPEPFQLSVACGSRVAVVAHLDRLDRSRKKLNLSRHTLVQRSGDGTRVEVAASFPRPGDYVLSLRCRPARAGGAFDRALAVAVRVGDGGVLKQSMPTTHSAWIDANASLESPTTGDVDADDVHSFRVSQTRGCPPECHFDELKLGLTQPGRNRIDWRSSLPRTDGSSSAHHDAELRLHKHDRGATLTLFARSKGAQAHQFNALISWQVV